MTPLLKNKSLTKRIYVILCLILLSIPSVYSQTTTIRGIVKDSVTSEPLPFVTLRFENSTVGALSKDNGQYVLSNNQGLQDVSVSFMGYKTKRFKLVVGQSKTMDILLEPEGVELSEIVVKPKKEKYSKKDNPAVELIKKVIARKDSNNISSQDYYKYEEYERLMIALNDFKSDQKQFKKFKFLPNYIDTSLIDNKPILPISIREKISDVHYRKDPKNTRRIVKAYQHEGLDQTIDTEGLDSMLDEIFKDVSIYDNSIILLLNSFISPLSSTSSVNYYKWYIEDTIQVNNEDFILMNFAPFNSRDIGFTGRLLVSNDGKYGVKSATLIAPRRANINFVDDLIIKHEFTRNEDGRWVPKEFTMAIDMSLVNAFKIYVDKTQSYNKIDFNQLVDSVYQVTAPEIKEEGYQKRTQEYWAENRPLVHNKDFRLSDMMQELTQINFIKAILKTGELMSSGFIATNRDPERNLVDIGTIPTFYSHNSVEGNRFRVTTSTTKNLHPHLFFYGYTAYGTKDNRFKYMSELTWSFRDVEKHKDEFPKHNLSLTHNYDVNNLGQRFTQASRDHILMSMRSSKNEKLTYNRNSKIKYEREYYSGFSGRIALQMSQERPAGKLTFHTIDALGFITPVNKIQTTEVELNLRYAPNEKIYQQRRRRLSIPSEKIIIGFNHALGLKNVLGGEYSYNKSNFSFHAEKWVTPYGKFRLSLGGEKLWGEVPFPLLITPSANSSFTIQNGSFYLLEPLEFMHDQQVSWEIYYHMGGWLFNRIPLLKHLKWREIFAFRGFYGNLSDKNNPAVNRGQIAFPQNSYTTNRKPYMEYNIGIENIFTFFRIDYVRRINYLDHPDVSKDGIRVSVEFNF